MDLGSVSKLISQFNNEKKFNNEKIQQPISSDKKKLILPESRFGFKPKIDEIKTQMDEIMENLTGDLIILFCTQVGKTNEEIEGELNEIIKNPHKEIQPPNKSKIGYEEFRQNILNLKKIDLGGIKISEIRYTIHGYSNLEHNKKYISAVRTNLSARQFKTYDDFYDHIKRINPKIESLNVSKIKDDADIYQTPKGSSPLSCINIPEKNPGVKSLISRFESIKFA